MRGYICLAITQEKDHMQIPLASMKTATYQPKMGLPLSFVSLAFCIWGLVSDYRVTNLQMLTIKKIVHFVIQQNQENLLRLAMGTEGEV